VTPVEGYARAGLVYVDDSPVALQRVRRALYAHHLLLETFESAADFATRDRRPLVAALLDVDLGAGPSGLDVARTIALEHPRARIAFITADGSQERLDQLTAIGRVFRKESELADVVAWLVDAAESSLADSNSG
jgi:ActR/RegA family two-component response regulator